MKNINENQNLGFLKRKNKFRSILKKNYTLNLIKKTISYKNKTLIVNNINKYEKYSSVPFKSNQNTNKRISFNNSKNMKLKIPDSNNNEKTLEKFPKNVNYKMKDKFKNSFYFNKNNKKKNSTKNEIKTLNDLKKIKKTDSNFKKSDISKSKIKLTNDTINVKKVTKKLYKFKNTINSHYFNTEKIINKEFEKLKEKLIVILDNNKEINKTRIINEKHSNITSINEIKTSLHDKESYLALYKFLNFFKVYNPLNLISSTYNSFDNSKKENILNTIKNKILNNRIEPPKHFPTQILRYFEKKNLFKEDEIIKGGDMIEWIEPEIKKLYFNFDKNNIKSVSTGKKLSVNIRNDVRRVSSKNIIENKKVLRKNSIMTRNIERRFTSFLKKPVLMIQKKKNIELIKSHPKIKRSPILQFIDQDIIFISNLNILNIYRISYLNSLQKFNNNNENLNFNLNQTINIMVHFKENEKLKLINSLCIWTRDSDKKKVLCIGLKSKVFLFYFN